MSGKKTIEAKKERVPEEQLRAEVWIKTHACSYAEKSPLPAGGASKKSSIPIYVVPYSNANEFHRHYESVANNAASLPTFKRALTKIARTSNAEFKIRHKAGKGAFASCTTCTKIQQAKAKLMSKENLGVAGNADNLKLLDFYYNLHNDQQMNERVEAERDRELALVVTRYGQPDKWHINPDAILWSRCNTPIIRLAFGRTSQEDAQWARLLNPDCGELMYTVDVSMDLCTFTLTRW
jgi:hypothetical protein